MRSENLEGKDKIEILLAEDVTFLNKASILKTLEQIPNNSTVEINASNTKFIHQDVIEIIEDFKVSANFRDIIVSIVNLYKDKQELPMQHFKLANGKK